MTSAPIETPIPGHDIRLHGFVPLDTVPPVSAATIEHLRAVTS